MEVPGNETLPKLLKQTEDRLAEITTAFNEAVKKLTALKDTIDKCMKRIDDRFKASQVRFEKLIEKVNKSDKSADARIISFKRHYSLLSDEIKSQRERVRATSGRERDLAYSRLENFLKELEGYERAIVREIDPARYEQVLREYEKILKHSGQTKRFYDYLPESKKYEYKLLCINSIQETHESFLDDELNFGNLQSFAQKFETMAAEAKNRYNLFSPVCKEINKHVRSIDSLECHLAPSIIDEYAALCVNTINIAEECFDSSEDEAARDRLQNLVPKFEKIVKIAEEAESRETNRWMRNLLRP